MRPASPQRIWRWVLALYGAPGVAPALLALQDEAGADVTLTLFRAWAGAACGHVPTAADEACLAAALGDWPDTVVGPLRAVRRRLERGDPLRRRLADLEIAAERRQLDRLAAALPLAPARTLDPGRRAACARAAGVPEIVAAAAAGLGAGIETVGTKKNAGPKGPAS